MLERKRWAGRRRTSLVGRFLAGVVVLAMASACGSDGPAPAGADDAADGGDAQEAAGDTSTTEGETQLESRRYVLGDCVEWVEDGTLRVDTDIVDCTTPHRMQIAGKYLMPYSDDYPPQEAWDALHTAECRQIVEEKLVVLDPYGRFSVRTIVPTEEGWANSDRTVWCGVGAASADPEARVSEDVRTADQVVRYAAGECITVAADRSAVIVTCDQAHRWEVVGLADFSDLAGPPTEDQIAARCTGPADAYLGGPPVAPWAYGYELLAAESWAAGTRTVHCFVGQMDAAGSQIEVVGPARG